MLFRSYLAMHDLEIRGAGEVLGENQSGNMMEIGFQLYNDMLSEAVNSLKAGKEPDLLSPLSVTTEINLHAPALLPDDYCGDVHERLSLYKRLAGCDSNDELQTLQEELIDRFGRLPDAAQALLDTHRLRCRCKPLGIVKLDAASEAIVVQFAEELPIDPSRIITLIQRRRDARMAGPDRIRFTLSTPDLKSRIRAIREILDALSS